MRSMSIVFLLVAAVLGAVAQEPAPQAANDERPQVVVEDPYKYSWRLLTENLGHEKAERRQEALSAIATLGREARYVQYIERAMSDPEEDVRQFAAYLLGEVGSRRSFPLLRKALEDDSAEVAFTAAQSLWKLGDRGARTVFYEVLHGERKTREGGVTTAITEGVQQFKSPQKLAMMGVERGAGMLLGPFSFGLGFAMELMKDSSAQARVLSATMLAEDPAHDSTVQLVEALGDKNWTVRAAVARALGTRNDRRLVANLSPYLHDDNHAVRLMTAASIVKLTEQGRRLR